MTITNQPPSGNGRKKAAKTATPNRLPSARERRPALAALAVVLIAGGAVLAGWLALRQSQTDSYLIITNEVLEGEQIERLRPRPDRAAERGRGLHPVRPGK